MILRLIVFVTFFISCDFSVDEIEEDEDKNDENYEYYEEDNRADDESDTNWFWNLFFGNDENCVDFPPVEGVLKLNLSISSLNPSILLKIYRDNIESGSVIWEKSCSKALLFVKVPNGDYAVSAEYKTYIDGKLVTVLVVDGGELDFEEDSPDRNGNCYARGRLDLDLTLRGF